MRIVLVRLSALGDVVHTWPLARAVRAARPDAHVTWIVEEPLRALVEGHPAVDAVLTASTRRWRRTPLAAATRAEIGVLRTRLRELEPDVVLDPQGTVKSATVVWMSGSPCRVGLARPWRRELVAGCAYTETVAGRRDRPHVVASNLELVRAVGGTPPESPPPPDGRWLVGGARGTDDDGDPYAAILPGAGRADKVLPVEVLASVCNGLASRGLRCVLAWGPGERERAEQILAGAGTGTNLAPPTDIPALARLLAGAAVVIGGDTGPVHLAASLRTPTVGVFLTTDWRRNGPLGDRVEVVAGTAPGGRGPSGSAAARRIRTPAADEILEAAEAALERR